MRAYAKAIVGALAAGLAVAISGLDDGGLSMQEWLMATSSALVTLGAVWTTPNTPAPPAD